MSIVAYLCAYAIGIIQNFPSISGTEQPKFAGSAIAITRVICGFVSRFVSRKKPQA